MVATHCKHGNKRSLGICPECHNEWARKRQRRIDREDFKRRIARIKGGR